MIRCIVKGNFNNTRKFLKRSSKLDVASILRKYADRGVEALRSATPVDTGKTADSWSYDIVEQNGTASIFWTNSNVNQNVNIAVILDYGHGTGWGGYVQGRHYISPAIQPIFDQIADAAWKEVTNS